MTPYRTTYWQIEYVWIFYVLAGVAAVVFLAGVGAHIRVWKKISKVPKMSLSGDALKRTISDVFLGRRVLQGDPAAGIMHLFIFWGFLVLLTGTALVAVHQYIFTFLEGMTYLLFSLAMEVGGILLIAGISWALVRRYLQRVPRLERRPEDAVVPLWLLLASVSGFILEGLRLAAQQPPWGAWSFAGWWMGGFFLPGSAANLYPYVWWAHGLVCLGFIAVIPYTKLFHVLGAPASIYFQGASGGTVTADEEEAAEFNLGDAIFFDACMRCGRCVASCPSAGAGEPFAPRDFVQAVRQALWSEHSSSGDIRFGGLPADDNKVHETLWYCTTCRACLEVCPVYGAAFRAVSKKRALAVEEGTEIPTLLTQTLEKLFKYNNPWESSKQKRGAWADGLEVADITKRGVEADLCYFVGCTTSFDSTAHVIARSFTRILQAAGVNFGILGKKEPCCGDIAHRVGELGLFQEQREGCLELFDKYGITDLITSSPHCFHTFTNEYPEAPFRARHYAMVLRELLADGRLRPGKRVDAVVTYHDPCYLGRHNRIFDEPREVIRSIPGINLVEMAHNRVDSLCCGGGGGRMWQDLNGEVKMSEVRLREAEATGADILVTACPLCLIMLEDARKAVGQKEGFRVMDLNELVLEALEATD